METPSWQIKFSSIKERNLYAFNMSLFSDVDFSVMDANGDKAIVSAHKYILAISSPVFEAMFYGDLAETGPTIDLPDCTNEGLQEMLRYVYSDELNLTGSNVLELLYLADKYMFPFLKEKCEEYLEKELKPEDVFHVLPQVRDKKLEQKCWDIVDRDTEKAVSSKSFLKIPKHMLCRVLQRETIDVDEVFLFQAVEKWASNNLKEKGLEDSRKNKRGVLGEDVIKLIRFPLMSEERFIEVVLPSGILKMNEVTEIMQFFKGLAPVPESYISKGRQLLIIPDNRFNQNQVCPSWNYKSSRCDAIDFKVNRQLKLVGVRLFGEKDCSYTVTLTLYEGRNKMSTSENVKFATESERKDGYYGYTVTLGKPVSLLPDVHYTIQALILGPKSYRGVSGKSVVTVNDSLVVTYMDSRYLSSGTSVDRGQFPTLIFK